MTTSDGLYIEVNLVALLIVGMLLLKVLLSVNKPYDHKLFAKTCFFSIIMFLSDIMYIIVSYFLPGNVLANYIINMVYFISTVSFAYSWFIYASYILGLHFAKFNLKKLVIMIPLILIVVLTLTSPFTHSIFYIDADNIYHRGPFHRLQVITMILYSVLPCIQVLRLARNKNDLVNAGKYASMCYFILWEVGAQIIQVFMPGYPTISIGVSMAVLSVYLKLKDNSISSDPLTQINNRNQLYNHMAYRLKSLPQYIAPDAERRLYLMIMDANFFKQINDNYGHVEGDEALKLIASAMKKTVVITGGFICRYGGDEFMLITEKKNDTEMLEITKLFKDKLKEVSDAANKPYELSCSCGFAHLSEKIKTFDALVEAADAEMYKEKEAFHKASK